MQGCKSKSSIVYSILHMQPPGHTSAVCTFIWAVKVYGSEVRITVKYEKVVISYGSLLD